MYLQAGNYQQFSRTIEPSVFYGFLYSFSTCFSLLIRSIKKKNGLGRWSGRVTECESRKFPFFFFLSKKTEIYTELEEKEREKALTICCRHDWEWHYRLPRLFFFPPQYYSTSHFESGGFSIQPRPNQIFFFCFRMESPSSFAIKNPKFPIEEKGFYFLKKGFPPGDVKMYT